MSATPIPAPKLSFDANEYAAVMARVIPKAPAPSPLAERLDYLERELTGLDNENPRRAALESEFRKVRLAIYSPKP